MALSPTPVTPRGGALLLTKKGLCWQALSWSGDPDGGLTGAGPEPTLCSSTQHRAADPGRGRDRPGGSLEVQPPQVSLQALSELCSVWLSVLSKGHPTEVPLTQASPQANWTQRLLHCLQSWSYLVFMQPVPRAPALPAASQSPRGYRAPQGISPE